jgi:putative resolvase
MNMKNIKLSKWAKENGLTYRTAWNLYHAGQLPVAATQLASGTILLEEVDDAEKKVVIYTRVSSHDQKVNLDGQTARCLAFVNKKKMSVDNVVSEIGSGLNGHRPKLISLLKDKTVTHIVVEHRDRLVRFGCEYIEALMFSQGKQLLVVDENEMNDDLVQDMIDVLTSFCARLYGRRSAKNRAAKAMKAVEDSE